MTEQPQPLEATLTETDDIYVQILPATDSSQAQPLGMSRVGDNQTMNLQPVID